MTNQFDGIPPEMEQEHLRQLSGACLRFWHTIAGGAASDTIVFIPEEEWDTFTPEPGVTYCRVRRPTAEELEQYGSSPVEFIVDPHSVIIIPEPSKPRAKMTYEEWHAESVRLIKASQKRNR